MYIGILHYELKMLLPKTFITLVQDSVLLEAELTFDCPQKVKLLLVIWVSVVKNPLSRPTLTTPRYLCSSKRGRMTVLSLMIQVKVDLGSNFGDLVQKSLRFS
jgi:hypothetical protein